jgi:pyruvate kinase
MIETKGPEIRTGNLKDGKPVKVQQGQALEIIMD